MIKFVIINKKSLTPDQPRGLLEKGINFKSMLVLTYLESPDQSITHAQNDNLG